jgi:hypothetical protein
LLPPPIALPPEVPGFMPWQGQLAALARQVLAGHEPSLAQLVSLCLWPEVRDALVYRVGTGAQPPLLPSGCMALRRRREFYTRSVWVTRLLPAGVWTAVRVQQLIGCAEYHLGQRGGE